MALHFGEVAKLGYRYRDAGKAAFQPPGEHLGFIAQEVQTVFPQWVTRDDSGYLNLSLRGFEAVAVRAIQELDAKYAVEMAATKAENAALRARINALETRLSVGAR